jgi:hypothetical protein
MFMKTMAVGPFDPAEFCVTGGLCTEARHLADCPALFCKSCDVVCREILESPATDCRKAMAAGASVQLPKAGEKFLKRCGQIGQQKFEVVKPRKGAKGRIKRMLKDGTGTRDLQIARGLC